MGYVLVGGRCCSDFSQPRRRQINSRRNRYCRENRKETASVICFAPVCANTADGPCSRNNTGRHIMGGDTTPLPIQDDISGTTPPSTKAHIEKCVHRKIRS